MIRVRSVTKKETKEKGHVPSESYLEAVNVRRHLALGGIILDQKREVALLRAMDRSIGTVDCLAIVGLHRLVAALGHDIRHDGEVHAAIFLGKSKMKDFAVVVEIVDLGELQRRKLQSDGGGEVMHNRLGVSWTRTKSEDHTFYRGCSGTIPAAVSAQQTRW